MERTLKITLKVILTLWLMLKITVALLSYFTHGAVDLTFLNPGVELGFQSLVFIKDTSLGLGIFIGFVVITALGVPLSFLVIPDSRMQNLIGFFAYALITLVDIVSVFILGFGDGLFILSLILSVLILAALLMFGKKFLIDSGKGAEVSVEDTADFPIPDQISDEK